MKRQLVLVSDAIIYGRRDTVNVLPIQQIAVPPSGQTNIVLYGAKCFHGVYIPAPYVPTGKSPSCSLCCPYEIATRENAVYKG